MTKQAISNVLNTAINNALKLSVAILTWVAVQTYVIIKDGFEELSRLGKEQIDIKADIRSLKNKNYEQDGYLLRIDDKLNTHIQQTSSK